MVIKNKYDQALHCLEIIAKKGGQDEDEYIYLIDEENDIKVLEKGATVDGDGVSVCVWVIEPYDAKRHLELGYTPLSRSVSVVDLKGSKYIKHKICRSVSIIANEINDDLEAKCEIENDDLSEEQWFELRREEDYKYAQIQVARELVAKDIAEKKGHL